MTEQPGRVYDTGVGTIGGRGQQATVPYPTPRHTLLMRTETNHVHHDHYNTAAEAIQQRIDRLKEAGTPYTREWMTLTYTDNAGAKITLTYQEPS